MHTKKLLFLGFAICNAAALYAAEKPKADISLRGNVRMEKPKADICLRGNGRITITLHGSKTYIVLPAPGGNHDITTMHDAIVNPANTMLAHGGGVAAKISEAAGPRLQEWSDAIPAQRQCHVPSPTGIRVHVGQAIVSPAFDLEKKGVSYIIHTVGPDLRRVEQQKNGDQYLYNAWYNALDAAAKHDPAIQEISFPSISTGIFNFPKERAGEIALQAVTDFVSTHPNRFRTINILLWKDTFAAYADAIEKVLNVENEIYA
jgi:O-acetyl-ADP-ribose deacetylase